MQHSSQIELSARQIVARLKGEWHGSYGMCLCPAHNDRTPSLRVNVGRKTVVFHCYAGCSFPEISAALRSLNLRPATSDVEVPAPPQKDLGPLARQIWERAEPVGRSLAWRYLEQRGIESAAAFARYAPRAVAMISGKRVHHPALILPLRNQAPHVHAIQRIFLDPVTGGKHPAFTKAKRGLASFDDAVIRMGDVTVDGHLNLAEGFEDAVSAQIINDLTNCWSVCGYERYALLAIPPEVRHITIWSQHGDNAEASIEKARPHLTANDRTLAVVLPRPDGDWNDQLLANRKAPA